MRDDQPYYYFDGYKMGQEMQKKSKEHEGHHCSGKCTKLETSEIVTDGQWIEGHLRRPSVFDGIGLTKPKEKCEHGFSKEFCCYGCLKIKQDEENTKFYGRSILEDPEIIEAQKSENERLNRKSEGHHCSWKCTKLDHEWMPEWNQSPDYRKCIKCNKQKTIDEKEELVKQQDPFWLKVRDLIRVKGFLSNATILAITGDLLSVMWNVDNSISDLKMSESIIKKIKLVSPALFFDSYDWKVTTALFSEKPTQILDDRFKIINVIWPAKDQFGREIWYEVEG